MKALRLKLMRLEAAQAPTTGATVPIDPQRAEAAGWELMSLARDWYESGKMAVPDEIAHRFYRLCDAGGLGAILKSIGDDDLSGPLSHLAACLGLRETPKPLDVILETARTEYAKWRATQPGGIPDAMCRKFAADSSAQRLGVSVSDRMVELALAEQLP